MTLINANFLIHRYHQAQSSENSQVQTESNPQNHTKVSQIKLMPIEFVLGRKGSIGRRRVLKALLDGW